MKCSVQAFLEKTATCAPELSCGQVCYVGASNSPSRVCLALSHVTCSFVRQSSWIARVPLGCGVGVKEGMELGGETHSTQFVHSTFFATEETRSGLGRGNFRKDFWCCSWEQVKNSKYTPNSRCCPSSCLLAVFLDNSSS